MMTPEQLTQEVTQLRDARNSLIHLWEVVIGSACPSEQQFNVWLELHNFDVLVRAIRETGRKQSRRNGAMCADHLIKFCSKVANEKTALERQAA